MTKTLDSRELSLDILMEILEKGSFCHLVLNQALSKYQYLEKQERSFITRLVEGTIEYLLQMDSVIDQYSKTPVAKMKPVIRTLLRMSVYQIYYMDRVPDSAACNEAVKLAGKRGFQGLKGFVNGLLRNIARNKENTVWKEDWIRYSIPKWLLSMWEGQYGAEVTKTMAESFLRERPLTVRCNLDKASREAIEISLKSQGIEVEESELVPSVLYLRNLDYLERLDAFLDGWISVQDLSAALVGELWDPVPGSYVVDVCGAPGGKSIHIADRMKGSGMVEVRDLTETKVNLIEQNIARSGFTNIRARVLDARVLDQASVGQADMVVADLPCSGLGIIGRKPDIKYHISEEGIQSLIELQREILSVVTRYVKPGGLLFYSTCTVNRRENEEQVAWMTQNLPLETVNIEGRLGDKLQAETMKLGYIQLLPGIHPGDGFFIAVLRRKDG